MSNKDVVVGVGIERCGKINAVNSGSESWTGIGVVAGCAAVWLITQGPHVKDMAMYERITFLHILQEVRGIGKTCNQLNIRLKVYFVPSIFFPPVRAPLTGAQKKPWFFPQVRPGLHLF